MAFNTVVVQNDTSYSRNSYVTLGIPFPSGSLFSGQALVVDGATSQREYVQWYPQGARWGDNSVKYARATFPVSIGANAEKLGLEVHNNSTSGGATSTFQVPIQASINNTRLEFSFLRKEFQKITYTITRWERVNSPIYLSRQNPSDGHVYSVTRLTINPSIRNVDPLAYTDSQTQIREANLGYYVGHSVSVGGEPYDNSTIARFGVKLQFSGYSAGYNFGVYGGINAANNIAAIWSGPNTIDLLVYDPNFVPNLANNPQVIVGIWEPYIPASLGYIMLDLNEATQIEGDGSSSSHYKRYKLFKRGNNSLVGGLPAPIWAEVVFDVYKNSDTVQFYFSWGNSYCEPVPNQSGGTYRQHTYYFDGDVRLRIYNRGTTGHVPRVGIVDSQYQLISGPTLLNGTTTCVLLNSEYEKRLTLTNGRTTQKLGFDNIPAGFTMAYKGYIVYTNSLTSSNNADLTGIELQAIANWNGQLPPFRSFLTMPSYVTSLENGKTRTRTMIDTIMQGYMLNQPLQLSEHLSFAQKTRTTEAGSQGLIFNLIPAYWSVITGDPYPLKAIKFSGRQEILRPIRRLTSTGACIRYLDYVISATHWYYTSPANGLYVSNADAYAGLGNNSYNTSTDPAPELQGIRSGVGLRPMDGVYSIVPDPTTTVRRIESSQSLTGYGTSHFSPDYILVGALLTMDYHLLKQCEFIQLSLWSQSWSGTRIPTGTSGGVDPGSMRRFTREASRPLLACAYIVEILGDSEFIEETKAKVRRIESGYVGDVPNQPGLLNFLITSLYGEKQYSTKHYLASQEPPSSSGLIQEWSGAPWMDFMGASHFWGLFKILREHSASTEADILKRTVRDLSATVLLHHYVNTDEYSFIYFSEVDIFNSTNLPAALPSPGDIIENAGNPGQYATVLLAATENTNSGIYRCIFTIKNRVGGPFGTGARIRNRTTGQIFRTVGGRDITVGRDLDGYKIGYIQSTTPRPEDISTPTWSGEFWPDYYKVLTKDQWLGTPLDYRYSSNESEFIPYRVGDLIREYTTGLSRHGYLGDGVDTWGLGTLSIAVSLANENYYDGYSSQIRDIATAGYLFNINNDLANYNGSTWDNSIGNNIFIEPLDSSRQHINHNAGSLLLYNRLYQPLVSGDGTIVSGNANHNASVVDLGISPRTSTYRQGTGISYSPSTIRLFSTAIKPNTNIAQSGSFNFGGFDIPILSDPVDIGITPNNINIEPESLPVLCKALQPDDIRGIIYFSGGYDMTEPISISGGIDDAGIFAYTAEPSGYVFWKRRIWMSLSGLPDLTFTGYPGSYGDPNNMGEDINFGTEAEWNHFYGQYISEDDIINVLGYPEGQTYITAGYKTSQWSYMPYDLFLKFGHIFNFDVDPIDPVDTLE